MKPAVCVHPDQEGTIMRTHWRTERHLAVTSMLVGLMAVGSGCASDTAVAPLAADKQTEGQRGFPVSNTVKNALIAARNEANGGFNLDMWASIVDRSGKVVTVTFTGALEGDQWQGSRVISAQKANTGNAFSLPLLALSSANLYWPTQPGGTLFGLQESNPVDPSVAYGGDANDYGTTNDFMVGKRIGGINVFGGGLALYASDGTLIGGLGVSGDASCADHNIAWKLRHRLALDYVPKGVSPTQDDNIIYDIVGASSASGFGHPECSAAATAIGKALPMTNPIRYVGIAGR
jgi:uncharacterized protein GlcG (DUF336 family)